MAIEPVETYSDEEIESMVYAVWSEGWQYDSDSSNEYSVIEIDQDAVEQLISYIKGLRDANYT